MAGLTTLRSETPLVRIGMTIGTLAEGEAGITWLSFRIIDVTLLAFHTLMQTS
jgi:hypothetical protein